MTNRMLSSILLTICVLCCCFQSPVFGQARDSVRREIVFRDHVVMVEDSLEIHDYYAMRDRATEKLFNAVSRAGTNFSEEIKSLVSGEDLSVQAFAASVSNAVLRVKIVSKVAFNSSDRPAKVKWLCFFGAQNLAFGNGSMGRTGNGLEILIFDIQDAPILWFPSLGDTTERELKNVEQYKQMIQFTSDRPNIQYDLRLRRNTNSELLFSWRPGVKLPDKLTGEALLKISKVHPMTENDLQSLISDMRIAKPGYYSLRQFE